MSPRKRTSPWRPSSARATEIVILEVSRPTKAALSCCMARLRCVRLGTGLSGATLVRRMVRDEPPPLQKRTYGLLNLTPPPIGAVLVNRFPGEQIIRTGRGMARAVESETPGLFHRHALNYLIGTRSWSPPRQALVWAALDVALASALQAAWYYKWVNPRTRYRERPAE